MADSELGLIVHMPQLDAARARRCVCPSNWMHLYSHCKQSAVLLWVVKAIQLTGAGTGVGFPTLQISEAVWEHRQERLEVALRNCREAMDCFGQNVST